MAGESHGWRKSSPTKKSDRDATSTTEKASGDDSATKAGSAPDQQTADIQRELDEIIAHFRSQGYTVAKIEQALATTKEAERVMMHGQHSQYDDDGLPEDIELCDFCRNVGDGKAHCFSCLKPRGGKRTGQIFKGSNMHGFVN